MSLYGMLNPGSDGRSVFAGIVAHYATGPFEVGRYRDAWVEAVGDEVVVAIYTRNGGGNRECWCEGNDDGETHEAGCLSIAIDSMAAHPWFRSDEDDDFDSTYATFRFTVDMTKVAQDNVEIAAALVAAAGEVVDPSERWLAMIDAIKGGSA